MNESGTGMWGLSPVASLLLIALAMIAIIWFLWALPSWLRRSTFRPGQPWTGEPLWVGAPAGAGGGSAAIEAARPGAIDGPSDGPADDGRGGASARW